MQITSTITYYSFVVFRFTRKFLSIERGIATGTSGATKKIQVSVMCMSVLSAASITPAHKGQDYCVMFFKLDKHNDELLEHQEGFCSHPHHSHQSEVVDQH